MIVQGFIDLIDRNAETLTQELIKELRVRKETDHYRTLPEDVLRERVNRVLTNVTRRLSSWLSKNKPKDTLFAYYRELGRERFREGIPLDEVVLVLMLIKRRIWKFVTSHATFSTEYQLDQLFELNYAVGLFFDRIVLAAITGYQEEQSNPA
ncbi:MAG TPA: hypothetical protein PLB81_07775 [Deltaproteobacteria bacterium]|nr:hypothetical protein [Deltaproteobacteria bacterium]